MPATSSSLPRSTPWHLWVVGVLALLWNGVGAFDYVMTQTRNDAYMSSFTPEQLAYFYTFPSWTVAFWALAVWGSVLGTLLLLLRRELAVPVLLGAFACMVVTSVHNFVFTDGLRVMGAGGAAFSLVVFLAALGLWIYARAMARRGVLI
jgi:hypothetical protein